MMKIKTWKKRSDWGYKSKKKQTKNNITITTDKSLIFIILQQTYNKRKFNIKHLFISFIYI